MLTTFALALFHNLGTFALVAMVFRAVIQTIERPRVGSVVVGILFGAAATLAICNSTAIAPGVFIDPRAVMLVLAAPFGGPIASLVAAAMACAVRIWLGGAGAFLGVLSIVLAMAIGLVADAYVLTRPLKSRQLIILGIASNLAYIVAFALPAPVVAAFVSNALLPLIIANFIGVCVLGRFLCNERAAIVRGRTLEAEALTDPLTRLPNRRMLEKRTALMFETAQLTRQPVAVIIIDIDHFKHVNDRFGHDIGDQILCEVADRVTRGVRRQDVVARFGGEEIVVAMPDTPMSGARIVAERIRRDIDEEVFHLDRKTANVTVSIGVASEFSEQMSFAQLFKKADEALYRAKEYGRNRVELAGDRSGRLPPLAMPA